MCKEVLYVELTIDAKNCKVPAGLLEIIVILEVFPSAWALYTMNLFFWLLQSKNTCAGKHLPLCNRKFIWSIVKYVQTGTGWCDNTIHICQQITGPCTAMFPHPWRLKASTVGWHWKVSVEVWVLRRFCCKGLQLWQLYEYCQKCVTAEQQCLEAVASRSFLILPDSRHVYSCANAWGYRKLYVWH